MAKILRIQYMEQTVRQNLVVTKSNDLILSKYKSSSVLEAKVLAISLTRIQMAGETPYARISTSEIKHLLYDEKDDKNIYTRLKKISQDMTSRSIFIENAKKNEFIAFTLVPVAKYKDGTLELKFNSEVAPYILNLKQNFTTYGLTNILKLKSTTSLRMYEILKKEVYKITEPDTYTQVEYSLAELKSLLGMIDLSETEMKNLRDRGYSWEEIEEKSNPKTTLKYNTFKTRVLEKAQKELKENTDICFEFKPIKGGRGARVKTIVFTIKKNDGLDQIRELQEYIDHNELTIKDLTTFLKDADGDSQRVVDAIRAADEQKYISNYVGWIRTAIRDGFAKPVETINGDSQRAKVVRAHLDAYEKEKSDAHSKLYETSWNKIKEKEDFTVFREEAMAGFSTDRMEDMYSPKELVDMYYDWKGTP